MRNLVLIDFMLAKTNLKYVHMLNNGLNGTVAKSLANGLVATGFGSQYQLIPRAMAQWLPGSHLGTSSNPEQVFKDQWVGVWTLHPFLSH